MNRADIKSNTLKSQSGNNFNKEVNDILIGLQDKGIIESFIKEPSLILPEYKSSKIRADFMISIRDGEIIYIDNTKTIRTDRVKQKQWDALRTKMSYGDDYYITYYVVVPDASVIGNDETREIENINVLNEKKKMTDIDYYSKIDDILYLGEFIEMLIKRGLQL